MTGTCKKLLSILLVISLSVSLCACGSRSPSGNSNGAKASANGFPEQTSDSKPVEQAEEPTPQLYDSEDEDVTLVFATTFLSPTMSKVISDFNSSHDNIHIDVRDYSEYNTATDLRAGYERFLIDIITGDVPDILDMSSELPYKKIAASGLLEDLYPYMDADTELSRADLFANILKGMELDGSLYLAVSGFMLQTAVGSAAVVGQEAGLTYDEYYECLASLPEGAKGFADYEADNETMLQMCVGLEMDNLIDWENGTCRFSSEDFIDLLKFADSFPNPGTGGYTGDETSMLTHGMQMLKICLLYSMYMPADYDVIFGGESTLVGFPTNSGIGHMICLNSGIAMSSQCRHKTAAWEFIRMFYTEQYQNSSALIPTNIRSFENKLAAACTIRYQTDENGNYLTDAYGEKIPVVIGSYFDGVKTNNIYSLTERQADAIRKAVSEATKLAAYDNSIMDIVLEAARPFFAGQKTAEEAAAIIQSKASIYVSEQG